MAVVKESRLKLLVCNAVPALEANRNLNDEHRLRTEQDVQAPLICSTLSSVSAALTSCVIRLY